VVIFGSLTLQRLAQGKNTRKTQCRNHKNIVRCELSEYHPARIDSESHGQDREYGEREDHSVYGNGRGMTTDHHDRGQRNDLAAKEIIL
jgi:hypothetical protein